MMMPEPDFAENWTTFAGQVCRAYPLQRYLAGSKDRAVFLTEYENRKAAIKLLRIDDARAEAQLSRWRLASKLSHPHLMRLYECGRCPDQDMASIFVVMEYADEDIS